jgi:hypothetical protein
MADYEIGYGKPPASGRFKPGVSGNPKGRAKRQPSPLAEFIKEALDAPIKYREGGRTKVSTYRELSLKMLVDKARNGDHAAAEFILKVHEQAERDGDIGIERILVENWLPDYPCQTGEQKTGATAAAREAEAVEWWRPSEE